MKTVHLVAINAKYIHSNLAIYDLKAYAEAKLQSQAPNIILGEYTINQPVERILEKIMSVKADVVAFSCYIWNVDMVYLLCRELRKLSPDTKIWLGGPEVSYDAAMVLAEHTEVDMVIVGEGEETFTSLVRKLVDNSEVHAEEMPISGMSDSEHAETFKLSDVQGIACRDDNGEVQVTAPRPAIHLDDIPFVYDMQNLPTLEDLKNRILYYESSRGCPFSCSYCLSSVEKSLRFRSLHLVKQELQFFLDHKVKQVKFIDRTFNCNREHAMAIWKYIHEHDNGVTNFHFEVSADLLGQEELALLRKMRPELVQLEIGMQTTNPDTIKEIRRTMNLDNLKKNMKTIHDYGNIHQHLDLIAGLPYEDYESFGKSFDDAFYMMPDQLQLGFLKVLKGSHMHAMQKEYGLVYYDNPPYEVLKTKWISYEEIMKLKQIEELVEVYFNTGQFKYSLAYMLRESKLQPFAFFETMAEFYEMQGYFDVQHKRLARYEHCIQFVEWGIASGKWKGADAFGGNCQMNVALLKELLTYDCYLRENVKARPSWCSSQNELKESHIVFFEKQGDVILREMVPEYGRKLDVNMMHLEPFSYVTEEWIRELERPLEESVCGKLDVQADRTRCHILFDYRNRTGKYHEGVPYFIQLKN